MPHPIPFTKMALTILITSAVNAFANPCETNFASSGNFLSGTSYKTFAELPNVGVANAFDGALADISKEPSWKILAQDKSKGMIQAVQAAQYDKGKVIPLNINIVPTSNGVKMNMDYVTPTGSLSPESAVKSQFCQIIQSAADSNSLQTVSANADKSTPAQDASIKDMENQSTSDSGSNDKSEFKKNGLPCVAEICLGDGLAELQKIKWDKIDLPYSTKASIALLKSNFRGKLKFSLPYLQKPLNGFSQFDNKALSSFDEVIADCGQEQIWIGKFTTPSGNPTTVTIALLPSQDNTKQNWTVIDISRRYPKAITKEQQQKVTDELALRYGRSDHLKLLGKRATEYTPYHSITAGHIKLALSINSDIRNRQKLHPECGGSSKVMID